MPGHDKLFLFPFSPIKWPHRLCNKRQLHGHPDGPRPYSIDVALPTWIRPGPKDGAAIAGAYLFAYISGFLGLVWAVATCMGLKPLSASKRLYKADTQDIIALAQVTFTRIASCHAFSACSRDLKNSEFCLS